MSDLLHPGSIAVSDDRSRHVLQPLAAVRFSRAWRSNPLGQEAHRSDMLAAPDTLHIPVLRA